MEIQKIFFDTLKEEINPNVRPVDVLSDILDVSPDAAYRRLRGEKELTLSELVKICSFFNISMDTVLNHHTNNVLFRYTHRGLSNTDNYEKRMDEMAELYEGMVKSPNREILTTAQDIPVFHFMSFPELALFKVYTWNQIGAEQSVSYDKFISTLDQTKLSNSYTRIMDAYRQIPSTEVWTGNTIENILRLLDYHYDINCFENAEYPGLICRQLLQLIENIEQWTENESKEYKDKKVFFRMYLSSMDLENNFVIMKKDGAAVASIKLYTINGIFTSNTEFCAETEKWIRNLISKSLHVSGASARERFKFFQSMKMRINKLAEKFEAKL
jgi:hypothetical protein